MSYRVHWLRWLNCTRTSNIVGGPWHDVRWRSMPDGEPLIIAVALVEGTQRAQERR